VTNQGEGRTDFYAVKYASFGSDAAVALRRDIFGDDIGQEGWATAAEYAEIADLLELGRTSHALDVCCGSGGPRSRSSNGADVGSPASIAKYPPWRTRRAASSRGLGGRATFAVVECNGPLPFGDGSFDAVLCVDAILHLRDRFGKLREWARLLRDKGRLAFTDVAIIPRNRQERARYPHRQRFLPARSARPREEAIRAAGLRLLRVEDRTAAAGRDRGSQCSARMRQAAVLQREEGPTGSGSGRRSMRWRQNWPEPSAVAFSLRRRKASLP
jgi:SAM-dependent methyltransferase